MQNVPQKCKVKMAKCGFITPNNIYRKGYISTRKMRHPLILYKTSIPRNQSPKFPPPPTPRTVSAFTSSLFFKHHCSLFRPPRGPEDFEATPNPQTVLQLHTRPMFQTKKQKLQQVPLAISSYQQPHSHHCTAPWLDDALLYLPGGC